MSRSGYSDDCDSAELNLWRGAVDQAIRGKRGQALLREMLAALDAMPEKVLIAHDLERAGQYCAMGTVGKARGVNMAEINPDDSWAVAAAFNIANALAKEIAYENDEATSYYGVGGETPEERWVRMRAWVVENLK